MPWRKKDGTPILVRLVARIVEGGGLLVFGQDEAAGIGAFLSLLIGVGLRRLTWKKILDACVATALTTSFMMLLAGGGKLFSHVLSFFLIPQNLTAYVVANLQVSPIMVVVGFQLIYILLGMFLDPLAMIFIGMPVMAPILTYYGFDLVWFGVLLMINIELAIITPPVGYHLYVVKGIADAEMGPGIVKLADVLKGGLTFCIADCVCLALVVIFPQIALWLPGLMQ